MNITYLRSKLRAGYWLLLRQFLNRPTTVTVDGISAVFRVGGHSEFQRVASLGGERAFIRDIFAHLDRDDTFYDVGANIGTHACLVGKKLESGHVVAFEPYPPNFERLAGNLKLNDIDATVEQCALSDRNGATSLNVSGEHVAEGGHSLSDGRASDIEIEMLTADTFVYEQDNPEPDVVKIDVEGAESRVLSGMERIITDSNCRLIYFESHEGADDDDDDVVERLKAAGFAVEQLQTRGAEIHYRAERP